MGLLDDLTPPKKNYTCKVRTELAKLDEKDQAVLVAAIADTTLWPAKTLANALQARGIQMIDVTISRHRQGSCSCSRI